MVKKKKQELSAGKAYDVYITAPTITICGRSVYSMQYVKMSLEEAEQVLEDLRKALGRVDGK